MTKQQELVEIEKLAYRLGKDSVFGFWILSIILALHDTARGERGEENLRKLGDVIRKKSFDF